METSSKPFPIELRAENLDWKSIKLDVTSWLDERVSEYLHSRYVEPLLISGPPGSGKTFATINGIKNHNKRYNNDPESIPRFTIYKRNEKLEILSNYKYGFKDGNPNLFIYDDIHYLMYDIIVGELPVSVLLNLLTEAQSRVTSGQKVIIIASDLVRAQVAKINDSRLDELILPFGEYNLDRREDKSYINRINRPAYAEILPLTFYQKMQVVARYVPQVAERGNEKFFAILDAMSSNLRDLIFLCSFMKSELPFFNEEDFFAKTNDIVLEYERLHPDNTHPSRLLRTWGEEIPLHTIAHCEDRLSEAKSALTYFVQSVGPKPSYDDIRAIQGLQMSVDYWRSQLMSSRRYQQCLSEWSIEGSTVRSHFSRVEYPTSPNDDPSHVQVIYLPIRLLRAIWLRIE